MTETEMFLSVAVAAARKAGTLILRQRGGLTQDDIGRKQASDFVTRVDRESERVIIETIRRRFPDHVFFAEESVKQTGGDGYRWIIDPLDGTTNFIHQYPVFSISIALEYRGETIVGVIYDPLRKELFCAQRGSGAFLNSMPIGVSGIAEVRDALIATGFPFRRKDLTERYLHLFQSIFLRVSDLRRAGSAALDLAYLACGRCDGFFEIGLSPWDIAAGALIAREAGAVVTDFGGGPDYLATGNIVAGSPVIHRALLEDVRAVFGGLIDR